MATFRRTYLETEFKKLNDKLSEHVDLYLIGGGAMSFQNLKVATKDIDVVLRSTKEFELTRNALLSLEYFVPCIRGAYVEMNASAILENADGFRWDLFVQVVCNGLQLSESMAKRSIELFTLKNVSVYMLAPEDIFVFKSVTSRDRDREDMYMLFTRGLDFDIIRNEIIWQNEHDRNFAWIAFFFDGLEEFADRYKISHPVISELHDLAYQDMLAQMLIERLKGGHTIFEELSQDLDSGDVKKVLKSLVKKGIIIQAAESKFSLNDLS
ncbi:DUF6036 family nucleotidyltransferase [Methanosarcina sp.]|uniref:DUF6036 family nucleotidyltransferase n=1 Tax=Methanosarcina sp. TaxID=2213 RepID=UPI002AB8E520|nr:DUF6036 family nucleotidyltransferase [Methanosarcina sp.]MDY9926894.1 DUF6036 family nucleotidyltransferase [Methanosarcina sp.]